MAKTDRTCTVDGCEREVGKHGARGMCRKDYYAWWKAQGSVLPPVLTGVRCTHCGTEYDARHSTRKYCSAPCGRLARRGESTGVTCQVDGCERTHQARGMCKMHYKRWARSNGLENPPSDKWSDRRRSNRQARRALLNGATNNSPSLVSAIIDRDGTVCGWCGTDIDLQLEWPHPLSKSVDHIQPVSKQGAHTLSNTRLLHVRCNSQRGNSEALGAVEGADSQAPRGLPLAPTRR